MPNPAIFWADERVSLFFKQVAFPYSGGEGMTSYPLVIIYTFQPFTVNIPQKHYIKRLLGTYRRTKDMNYYLQS